MTTFKRILAFALIAFMLTGLAGPLTMARADGALVLTLGADLSAKQKQNILDFFNVREEDAMVITVTNADERKLLEGQYTAAQIGTKTLSCALVNPTASGGIQVKTANLSVVTSGRIASILSTSGITDCEVLAAAPFMVSGTGALTGVMMGYEEALGVNLDPEKQQMAIQESTTVTKIGETMGQEEATLVINDIKIRIVRDNAKEESEIADAVNITVDQVEEQLAQLAAVVGKPAPRKLKQDDREVLYDYGRKISAMDYDYDSMKLTLQRVTVNAANAIGIDDPITETFEDLSAEDVLPENSILRTTNDQSMGDKANITATDTASMDDAPTLDAAAATVTLNNSLYALFDIPMTWTDARRYCRQLGGDLASVTTLEEQTTIEELGAMSGKDYSWLGGKCDANDPRWRWSNGETLKFSNWDDNQPDGFDQGEYFIRMTNHDVFYSDWTAHAGKWNDAREDGDAAIPLDVFGFICEIPQERRQAEAPAAPQTTTGAKLTGLKLTPVASLEGASQFVYGANVLLVSTNEGKGLADLNGNVLTDQWFYLINSAYHGLMEVITRPNDAQQEGVLDQAVNLVVPCVYDDVSIKSNRWALGIKWALDGTENDQDNSVFSGSNTYYARITDVDIYYIKDGRGTLLRTLSRQEYGNCDVKDDYINITDRNNRTTTYDSAFNVVATDVSYTGNFSHILPEEYSSYSDYDAEHYYGLQDAGGNVVLAPFADSINDVDRGLVLFGMNDPDGKALEGIATLNGEILLPAAFDWIYESVDGPVDEAGKCLFRWNVRGYYLTIQDDIYRFAADGGEITCDTGIDKDTEDVEYQDLALKHIDGNGQITLYAADGQVTQLASAYSNGMTISHSSGLLWETYNEDTSQDDLVDWHGNLLAEGVYNASMSGDGNWLAVSTDYNGPLDIYAVTYVYDDGHEESPEGLAAPTEEAQTPGEETVEPGEPADATEPEEAAEPAEEAAGSTGEAEAASADNAELIAALENTITTIQNTDFDANRERIAQILDKEASLLTDVNADAANLMSSAAILVRGGADVDTTAKLIESALALLK